MLQAISAGHQKTLEAAKIILTNGGNAFDAAIAAAFAMFITEPCMSSAGAGGFALIHTPQAGVKMLDFFTQTPIEKNEIQHRDFYPIEVNFGNETETFHVGLASMATPGMIKGLFDLHKHYASLPLQILLEPAKQFAREGVAIDEFQYIDMGLLESILAVDPSMKEVFFKNGQRLQRGEILKMPHLISFFDFLEEEGERGFYFGEISKKIALQSFEKGGYLQRKDFENYECFWRKPLNYPFKNNRIYLPNGPSLGGALMALNLEDYKQNQNWAEAIHKTRKEAFSIKTVHTEMTRKLGQLNYQSEGSTISSKGTSHFNILDKEGNAIAFTCSLGEGSGYFIPDTDMQMNNMLGESFLLPNGFHSWKENSRLNSMMTPTMMLDKTNKLKYLGGSGGAGRIPFMIAQVIQKIEDGLTLQEATNSSRVYVHENTLHTEDINTIHGFSSELKLQEWDYHSLFFGGVHSIHVDENNNIQAAADPRRFGVSEVF